MDTKFFQFAFATSGDRATIPNTTGDGTVNYQQGFGPDYERDQETDPLAKNVPRDETNQLYFDITENLRQYQTEGFPQWITSANNGGTAFPYRIGACVAYQASGIWKNYVSLKSSNTSLPTVSADWSELSSFVLANNIATQPEAVAGTDNTKVMTPLRVAQAVPQASTTVAGRIQLATVGDVSTGTAANRAMTPASLAGRVIVAGDGLTGGGALGTDRTIDLGTPGTCNGSTTNNVSGSSHQHAISHASTTVSGAVLLATTAEAEGGTNTTDAITPATWLAAYRSALTAYEGSDADQLTLPIHSIVLVGKPSPHPNRNATMNIYIGPVGSEYTTSGSAGDKLVGQWRARGLIEAGGEFNVLAQRVS